MKVYNCNERIDIASGIIIISSLLLVFIVNNNSTICSLLLFFSIIVTLSSFIFLNNFSTSGHPSLSDKFSIKDREYRTTSLIQGVLASSMLLLFTPLINSWMAILPLFPMPVVALIQMNNCRIIKDVKYDFSTFKK